MRYLGIDFGSKRVGVAYSNETNEFALPLAVLVNDENLVASLQKIIAEKEVGTIILGESKNFRGEDNVIMAAIRNFKGKLEEKTGLPVFLELELLTSAEANRMNIREPGQSRKSGVRLRRPQVRNTMLDASAAALILQSYLAKQKNL